jgi:predicted ABC-type ATPase
LRVFAGPNGSGKTTLAKNLSADGKLHLKIFVNADEIENELVKNGFLPLDYYNIKTSTSHIRNFVSRFGMSPEKLNRPDIITSISISNNKIYFQGNANSYIASDIASFIREQLLEQQQSFAFETVFSHESKLQFMKKAKSLGYKVYFYFLATDDPEININRVNVRVDKKGHAVDPKKIVQRYYRSLDLLYDAVKTSSREYIFDNSGKYFDLIAEVEGGRKVEILDFVRQTPNWFVEYLFNKISK